MPARAELPFHSDLGCYVQRLEYDFVTRTGTLIMCEISCTDMGGCIDLFKRIDPKVVHIRTIAGSEPDTEYRLMYGRWHAKAPRKVKKDGLVTEGECAWQRHLPGKPA